MVKIPILLGSLIVAGMFITVPALADSEFPPVHQTPAVVFDKNTYTWGDQVRFAVISPLDNLDPRTQETFFSGREWSLIRIGTITEPIFRIENYSLIETGPDTGMFAGSFTLVTVGGNKTGGMGPDDGLLEIGTTHDNFSVDFGIGDESISYYLGFTHPSDPTPRHHNYNGTNSEFPNAQFRWVESISPYEGIGQVRIQSPEHNISTTTTDRMMTLLFVGRAQDKIYLPLMETGDDTGVFEGDLKVATYDSKTSLMLTPGRTEPVGVLYFEDDTLNPASNPLKLANSLEPSDSTPPGTHGTEPTFVIDRTAFLPNQELLIHGRANPNDGLVVLLSHQKYELGSYRFVTADKGGSFDASISWSDPKNISSGTYHVQVLRPSDGLETTKEVTFASEEDLRLHKVDLAPRQQLKMGIAAQDIVCQRALHLIFKQDGQSLACVKPQTKQILIERGWAENRPAQSSPPPGSLRVPQEVISITINDNDMPVIPIKRGETREIGVLIAPKIPIILSSVDIESYFGSACGGQNSTAYCLGKNIAMKLSDESLASQKEITLTVTVPNNMTVGQYGYMIVTKTTFDSPHYDDPITVGNSLRFDLLVQ